MVLGLRGRLVGQVNGDRIDDLVGHDDAIYGAGAGDFALDVGSTDDHGIFLGRRAEGLGDFFDATVNGDLGGVVGFFHGSRLSLIWNWRLI